MSCPQSSTKSLNPATGCERNIRVKLEQLCHFHLFVLVTNRPLEFSSQWHRLLLRQLPVFFFSKINKFVDLVTGEGDGHVTVVEVELHAIRHSRSVRGR